ncbi:MAG: hypothetical protein ACK6CT_04330 [Planctomycetia bacterium]
MNEARAGAADNPSSMRVTNVTLTPRDAATATITFDITWNDSWRHEVNHDAAWVFFKARPAGATEWQHVRLAADKVTSPRGFGQAAGGTRVELCVPDGSDGFTGLFVRRAEYGWGTVKATGVTAVWDLSSAKGVTPTTKVDLQGFGIEMVFVPEGPFELGGGSARNRFHLSTNSGDHGIPYRVTGPGAIPTGRQPGKLWARTGCQPEDNSEIPAAFPNGYAALYCMKKSVIGVHYAAFLNAIPLERVETSALIPVGAGIMGRSESDAGPVFKAADDAGGYRNVHGLTWACGATFAAWAGLRPMTELEFEKIIRGPITSGWQTGDEVDHPSYWGVTTINGWRTGFERAVTIDNATGRRFRGSHGLGTATLPADWPQEDGVGVGIRGGYAVDSDPSSRSRVDQSTPKTHDSFRGVRTAPKDVGL